MALKTIELYESRNILHHVRKVSPRFQQRLAKLNEHPLIADTQSVGLIAGMEVVADKTSKKSFDPAKGVAAKFAKFAEEEGLIVRPLLGDRIALCPPLIISETEIDEMFDRLRAFTRARVAVGAKRKVDITTVSGTCARLHAFP